MWRLRLFLIISILCAGSIKVDASHIVGGYIRYDFVNDSNTFLANYDVTVVLYRDVIRANSGAIFTQDIPLTIFTQGSSNVEDIRLLSTKIIVDSIQDPCFVSIDSLVLEEGIYRGRITLRKDIDHLLVYQRCCRNSSIDNLVSPSNSWGNTWTIEVPNFNLFGPNSSPDFNSSPPIAFCPNQILDVDLSATDADGDSLVYIFCEPYSSPRTSVEPDPAFPPPYLNIAFQLPRTAADPIPSNPAVTVNRNTGIMTGTPNLIGQYVIGLCIEEYRGGRLLTTTRRDLQVNTGNCNPVILTAVQDQSLVCDGRTVDFTNNTPSVPGYEIKGYRWDFGDPTTLADTSRLENPSYTYPDTGLYTITLIANPGIRCSSQTTNQFQVYDVLDPEINVEGNFCVNDNRFTFKVEGEYADYADVNWNFGTTASLLSSNQDSVAGIRFSSNQLNHTVNLTVSQDICTETRTEIVQLFPNPTANFSSDLDEICPPFPVQFRDRSLNVVRANYIWDYGDGDSAFISDPTHVYQKQGNYQVRLTVQTTDNCIDTVSFTDSIFASRSFSTNEINFGYGPNEGCSPLAVQFSDSSTYFGSGRYFWDFDNNNLSNEESPVFQFTDTGYYDVSLLLITADTCEDTLQLFIDSAIRVLPDPVAEISISEDTVSLKEALIDIDATASRDYEVGSLFIDGRFIGNEPISSYRFRDTGKHTISWVVDNEFDCLDTVTAELFIFDEFEFIVPNIFTPNGDGVNDFFKVRACGVYEYEIIIFNRYGKQVYTSQSLQEGWNGRINDYKANPGVYFYKITIKDLNGDYLDYNGSLTLHYE